jgi:hypothetical protein
VRIADILYNSSEIVPLLDKTLRLRDLEILMAAQPIDVQLHTFRSPLLQSVVHEAITFFNNTPVHPLPPAQRFAGVGVYALYYFGDFDLYDFLAAPNQEQCTRPIYVGKAVPEGSRTGRASPSERARNLHGRLREHAGSIAQAENLNVDHFRCRFMLLLGIEADLIATVESQLIRLYTPLWNTVIAGFGIHHPGSGRFGQALSEWDAIHPGRPWGSLLTGVAPQLLDIIAKIEQVKSRLPLP